MFRGSVARFPSTKIGGAGDDKRQTGTKPWHWCRESLWGLRKGCTAIRNRGPSPLWTYPLLGCCVSADTILRSMVTTRVNIVQQDGTDVEAPRPMQVTPRLNTACCCSRQPRLKLATLSGGRLEAYLL